MKEIIDQLIDKWQNEHDYYQKLISEDVSETIQQLYLAHFEVRQTQSFIDDLQSLKAKFFPVKLKIINPNDYSL